ncbi:hypothetical protein [Cedecea colo]|nr:hypothetical protein [Cedecea colo]
MSTTKRYLLRLKAQFERNDLVVVAVDNKRGGDLLTRVCRNGS